MSIMIGGKPKNTSTPDKSIKEVDSKGSTSNAIKEEDESPKKRKRVKKED